MPTFRHAQLALGRQVVPAHRRKGARRETPQGPAGPDPRRRRLRSVPVRIPVLGIRCAHSLDLGPDIAQRTARARAARTGSERVGGTTARCRREVCTARRSRDSACSRALGRRARRARTHVPAGDARSPRTARLLHRRQIGHRSETVVAVVTASGRRLPAAMNPRELRRESRGRNSKSNLGQVDITSRPSPALHRDTRNASSRCRPRARTAPPLRWLGPPMPDDPYVSSAGTRFPQPSSDPHPAPAPTFAASFGMTTEHGTAGASPLAQPARNALIRSYGCRMAGSVTFTEWLAVIIEQRIAVRRRLRHRIRSDSCPLPPARFSTTTGCFHASPTFCPSVRATMSVPPSWARRGTISWHMDAGVIGMEEIRLAPQRLGTGRFEPGQARGPVWRNSRRPAIHLSPPSAKRFSVRARAASRALGFSGERLMCASDSRCRFVHKNTTV
jgi:hypothetical protein